MQYGKNGAVTKEYLYDAFGNERSPDVNDANPFRYCGEYFDTETGDIYLRARYYRPVTGRFTQMDSVWSASYTLPNEQNVINPLSLNLYTYCYNNPIYYNDRTGAAPDVVQWWKDVTRRGEADWFLLVTLGAYKDPNNIYHIYDYYWQGMSCVGYNDLYDMIFDAVCDMKSTKFQFSIGGKQFAIWVWKGDYINLGAGAELGIYWNYGGEQWWTGIPYAVPMTLQLIDTRNGEYTGIFNWEPEAKQWWITGFDPSHQGMKAKDLQAVYTLDLSGQINMFDTLKQLYETDAESGTRWKFDSKHHRATLFF